MMYYNMTLDFIFYVIFSLAVGFLFWFWIDAIIKDNKNNKK